PSFLPSFPTRRSSDLVTHMFWLLGSATGSPARVAGLHGPRLACVLREVVDTPVRGFVYEAAGASDRGQLERGAQIVREAGVRWRDRKSTRLNFSHRTN